MALSELQKRKLKVEFQSYDLDGDGTINQDDFEGLAAQIARVTGIKSGASEYEQLKSEYQKHWNELKKIADSDGNDEVSLDEWYKYSESIINDQKQFDQYVIDSTSRLVELIDTDNDGKLTLENYKRFFTAYGLGASEEEAIFKKLDANGDGFVTKDEVLKLVREFYLSQDENAPGNWILGKF